MYIYGIPKRERDIKYRIRNIILSDLIKLPFGILIGILVVLALIMLRLE